MTLTDEQYVEVLATVKRRDVGVLAGYLHVSRWCDGSTACAVTSEPHGHWRGAYSVRSADVIVRLLDENERLRTVLQSLIEQKKIVNVREADGTYIDVTAWCKAALEPSNKS